MTATNPDASGNVTLNGAPGAVLPNALVTAANASQGLTARRELGDWLLPSALAQAENFSTVTTAAADGSFQLIIAGQVGETLEVTQTVDGTKSPPTSLTIKGVVINLGVPARGVAIDEGASTAFVTGGNENDGFIYSLNLDSSEPLPSLPDPLITLGGVPGVGPVTVDAETETGLAVSTAQNVLAVFPVAGSKEGIFPLYNSVVSPLAVDALPGGSLAAVGLESPSTSVSIHDSVDGSFECSFLISNTLSTVPTAHLRTSFVKFGFSFDFLPQIVAISEYADGSVLVSRFALPSCFSAPVPNGSELLPQGTVPGGLGTLSATDKAIISDTATGKIYLVDFTGEQPMTTLVVGPEPKGVEVDEQNGRAFIVNSGDNSITLLNLETFATLKLVGVGLGPSQLAVDGNLNRGLLISDLDGTVVLVDLDIPL